MRDLSHTELETTSISATEPRRPQAFPRHESHASTTSATSDDECFDKSSTPYSLKSTSQSLYSYTSIEDETPDIPLHKITSSSRSRTRMARDHQSRPTPQRLVLTPFIILAVRMYEAHMMLVHLFVLMNVLVLGPKLRVFLEGQMALQAFVWGRTSHLPVVENRVEATTWSFHDESLLPATMKFCQNLGVIGALATTFTLFLHDLYHREARKRWQSNNGKVSFYYLCICLKLCAESSCYRSSLCNAAQPPLQQSS